MTSPSSHHREIWKYTFEIDGGDQIKRMPRGAAIVHVGTQNKKICLWAIVNPNPDGTEERTFIVHGIGHDTLPTEKYLGTAVIDPFAWHLFEAT